MKNKTESGRSMVEMIGVLALIGLLSLGSLSGYEYALASYRAGQIRDALFMAKKSASVNTNKSQSNEVIRLLKANLNYTITYKFTHDLNPKYEITVENVAASDITVTAPAKKEGCSQNETSNISFQFSAL